MPPFRAASVAYAIGRAMLAGVVMAAAVWSSTARAQIDPDVRDAVIPATIQVAGLVLMAEGSETGEHVVPLGSGTVVSSDGLILTNHHVVDLAPLRLHVDEQRKQYASQGRTVSLTVPELYLVLGTTGKGPPERRFTATLAADRPDLDLAVLRIAGGRFGEPIDPPEQLPFVELGDSDALEIGDPLHVFGFPASGGGTLKYTQGTVSSFDFQPGILGLAWIDSDAKVSGGNSGGTAVDDNGRLVGVPTLATEMDCRPADTNGDGVVDEGDIGCIPAGDSFLRLRPINLAKPILASLSGDTEPTVSSVAQTATTTPSPTSEPSPTASATKKPTSEPSRETAMTPTPGARQGECETLIAMASEGSYYTNLFEVWEVDSDLLVWTFRLRSNVVMTDGRLLTSLVVRDKLEQLSESSSNPSTRRLAKLIKSVSAVDELTVVIELEQPSMDLIPLLRDPTIICIPVQ